MSVRWQGVVGRQYTYIVCRELEINVDSDFLPLKWLSNQSRMIKEPVISILYNYGSYLTAEIWKHLSPGSDCEFLNIQS